MLRESSKKQRFQKGFSLIELSTIAIIAIVLISLILVSIKPNQAKSRDTKRVAEINTIRTALQLFYMDNGRYPIEEDGYWCSIEAGDSQDIPPVCENLPTDLEPYLPEIPGDPLYDRGWEPPGKRFSYQYTSTSSGAGYKLYADFEIGDSSYEVSSFLGKDIIYTPPE